MGHIDWLIYNFLPNTPHNYNETWLPVSDSIFGQTTNKTIRIPQSCCYETKYDNFELICEKSFTRGCNGPLQGMLIGLARIISSSALIFGFVQV